LVARLRSALPAAQWLRSYDRQWLRGDIVAGVTLAAYLLPAGLGDASLANLPPEAGLYACLFSGLVFWLFCSSRHTSITVTSAISLLVGASLGDVAGGDTTRFGALAAGTALLVALIALIAWLAKAGSIVNFISESVMVGFKCGVALFLASTQLPKLFGIHGAHGDFWANSGHFLRHLRETKPHVPDSWVDRLVGARAREGLPQALAHGPVGGDWRHRGFIAVQPRHAWREAAGRPAAGSARA
jgi:MFS superfamily sulfate permease-like transporter